MTIFSFFAARFTRLIGAVSRLQFPVPLMSLILRFYCLIYDVKLHEAEKPLESYQSLAEFFVRRLRPGCRTLPTEQSKALLCPVDGRLLDSGSVRDGLILDVKGAKLPLAELLAGSAFVEQFARGYYWNLYLAPGGYHQVHSPVTGKVIACSAVPGGLFPVNVIGRKLWPDFAVRSERVVTYIESRIGLIAVVMVGAVGVGTMTVSYDELPRMSSKSKSGMLETYQPGIQILAGEHLGTFHLGSSVILISDRSDFQPLPSPKGEPVLLFQPLVA